MKDPQACALIHCNKWYIWLFFRQQPPHLRYYQRVWRQQTPVRQVRQLQNQNQAQPPLQNVPTQESYPVQMEVQNLPPVANQETNTGLRVINGPHSDAENARTRRRQRRAAERAARPQNVTETPAEIQASQDPLHLEDPDDFAENYPTLPAPYDPSHMITYDQPGPSTG